MLLFFFLSIHEIADRFRKENVRRWTRETKRKGFERAKTPRPVSAMHPYRVRVAGCRGKGSSVSPSRAYMRTSANQRLLRIMVMLRWRERWGGCTPLADSHLSELLSRFPLRRAVGFPLRRAKPCLFFSYFFPLVFFYGCVFFLFCITCIRIYIYVYTYVYTYVYRHAYTCARSASRLLLRT